MLERVKVPTMSRLVAAMEGEGLVRRVPHGSGARELRLSLLESLLSKASPREIETVRAAAEIVDRPVL